MGPHDAQAVPWEKSRDCPTRLKFGHFPFGIVFLLVHFLHVLFIFSVHCPPTATTWVWGGGRKRSAPPGERRANSSRAFSRLWAGSADNGSCPLLMCVRFHLQPEDEPQLRAGTKTCSLIQGSQVLSCSFLLKGDA